MNTRPAGPAMHTYIIAEVGQNHNGSFELAQRLIEMTAMPIMDGFQGRTLPGVDAVKFTKRDLGEELSRSQMDRPYESPHAFGGTYGEHRAALELSDEQHAELYAFAKARGLEFVETLCAVGCLSMLRHFTPDRLKVASRDLTNLPLLEAMAETRIPMILSTGMGGREELDAALDAITRHHSDVTILHCLSQYPAEYERLNLNTIPALQRLYPEHVIGYSDHSIGIMAPAAAVALGARCIEKHVTLDRQMKGSDHWGSLEPEGLWRMTRDIRNLEAALGEEAFFASEAAAAARAKLERSVAAARDLPVGHVIEEADLCLLSPGDGLRWTERGAVLGRRVRVAVPRHELVYPHLVEPAEHPARESA